MLPAVILNVEDNEPNRYARRRILMNAGFTTYDASTGQGALDLAALHRPDLILLDINLPDLSGIEVCRRLKSAPESASTIVLQISASAITAPHATAALDNGADAYLAEPVDASVLIATINALLRLKRAERDLQESNEALNLANQRLGKLLRELQSSNEDLQQFAYFASHDLQDPLRTVTSFVEKIAQSAGERLTEEERRCMGYVVEGAQRMERLILALLSYAELGHAQRVSHSEIDLNSVVDRTIDDLRDRIVETGGRISKQKLPKVLGDAVQLGDVFKNLLVNAIKYRRQEEPLDILISAVRTSPAEVKISVRDNGQGIKPAYHELIFLPFKRLHGREIPGTGIGLAICKRIVEAHGGRIYVESSAGQGSVFNLSLPCANTSPAKSS